MSRLVMQPLEKTYHSNPPHEYQSYQNIDRISDTSLVEDAPIQGEKGELHKHDDTRICQFADEQAEG